MKDAQREYLEKLRFYRDEFERLAQVAEDLNTLPEARLNLECAVKMTDHLTSMEAILSASDDEEIEVITETKKTDDKLS